MMYYIIVTMCLLAGNAEALSPIAQPQEMHYEHLKSILEMTGLAPLHRHRRQAIEVDEDTLQTCTEVTVEAQCTSGFFQSIIDETLRCGFRSVVPRFEVACRQNEARNYCGAAGAYVPEIVRIMSTCQPTVCSSECRSNIMILRERLGCCINLLLNGTIPQFASAFSFSLWSRCGIETVPNTCPPSQLDLSTPQIRSCSQTEYSRSLFELICTRSNSQPIRDALSNSNNCTNLVNASVEACGVIDGDLCLNRLNSIRVNTNLRSALSTCTLTDTTCPSTCRNSLATLRNDLDCCFNNFFNATIVIQGQQQLAIANNDLWKRCGLETLGRCPIELSNGAVSLHTMQSGMLVAVFSVLMNTIMTALKFQY